MEQVRGFYDKMKQTACLDLVGCGKVQTVILRASDEAVRRAEAVVVSDVPAGDTDLFLGTIEESS
jgi:hypothetical protein